MRSEVIISISEFVEPRDRGEISIRAGNRVIARKSNIALFGDRSVIMDFVGQQLEALKPHLADGLVFENVDPVVQEHIKRLLG